MNDIDRAELLHKQCVAGSIAPQQAFAEISELLVNVLKQISPECKADSLHQFIIGETYWDMEGDELVCEITNSTRKFDDVPQPIEMRRTCDGERLRFTVEGWFGCSENDYPGSNIDMTRLPEKSAPDGWITAYGPSAYDTCEAANQCVEVTYRSGLMGWERYDADDLRKLGVVAWRKIRPVYAATEETP